MTPVLYSITQIFMSLGQPANLPPYVAYERPNTPATATRVVDARTPRAEQRPVQAPRNNVRQSIAAAGVIPQHAQGPRGPSLPKEPRISGSVMRKDVTNANSLRATHHPKDYTRAKGPAKKWPTSPWSPDPIAEEETTLSLKISPKREKQAPLPNIDADQLIADIRRIIELATGVESKDEVARVIDSLEARYADLTLTRQQIDERDAKENHVRRLQQELADLQS